MTMRKQAVVFDFFGTLTYPVTMGISDGPLAPWPRLGDVLGLVRSD